MTGDNTPMKFYLLKRKSDGGWDEARGFVVAADNPTEARDAAAVECGDEGSDVWRNGKLSTCREIGTVKTGAVKRGVVLRDFLAG